MVTRSDPATDFTPTPTRKLSEAEQRAMTNAVASAKAEAARNTPKLVKRRSA